MNEAQIAFRKLCSGVGNVNFYISPGEQKSIEDALEPKVVKAPAKKKAAKKQ